MEATSMQMLMLIVKSEHKDKVEAALSERRVLGYTEIPTVYGLGSTGPRLGSRAFPETSSIILTACEREKVDDLIAAIDDSCAECRAAMRMVVWDISRMI